MKGGSYLWLILMFFIVVYLSFEPMVELVVAGCWFTILQKKTSPFVTIPFMSLPKDNKLQTLNMTVSIEAKQERHYKITRCMYTEMNISIYIYVYMYLAGVFN